MKKRLFARLHPTKKLSEYTPPKICSECWWVATVRLCYSDDEILNSHRRMRTGGAEAAAGGGVGRQCRVS
jgi:hypothetical protein